VTDQPLPLGYGPNSYWCEFCGDAVDPDDIDDISRSRWSRNE